MRKSAPDDPLRLPVKIDATSNGEFFPVPLPARLEEVNRSALASSEASARRLGLTRRAYLASTCGAAGVLLALNGLGCRGGRYRVPAEAALDPAAADAAIGGDEFIFDVQTHEVSGERAWWETDRPSVADFLSKIPQARCGADHWVRCYTDDVLVREVFLESDTDMAVLSALYGDPNPLHADEAARTRERVAALGGGDRLRIHAIVQPNAGPFERVRDGMAGLAERFRPSAWKLYPVWGPAGVGYLLDDDLGSRTIEAGLAAGVPIFAVHKGLPLAGMTPEYTRPQDVGRAARKFPRATFLVYHSGFEGPEGAYDPKADRGVDALLGSLAENGIGNDGNVYAELGSVWRFLMARPDAAAHVLGKLLLHLGEDRILWGTDCIWYGSPQDQIQAFRAFEISAEYRERFGYPALTPAAKRKIFGLNAARVYGVDPAEVRRARREDDVSRAKREYRAEHLPAHDTHGPRTRREMLRLLALRGGAPD
jgi:predicted TIM-barrel fold metal-dependent hydrolase